MSAPPPYAPADDPNKYPETYPQAGYPPQPAQYPPQPTYPGYPPQPAPAQPAGQQQHTVVVTVPTVHTGGVVGNAPYQTTCSNCHQSVVTTVSYETGTLTWLIFAILCFTALWCCACIPFCVDDCKDVVHTCPSCGVVLGRRKRL